MKPITGLAIFLGQIVAAGISAQEWEKTFGTPDNNEYGTSVQQTADGGFIAAGSASVGNSWYAYLIKTDANGNLQWEKKLGWGVAQGRGVCESRSAAGVPDGYVVTGSYAVHDIKYGHLAYVYIVKTNLTGDVVWEKTLGGMVGSVPVDQARGSVVLQAADGGYVVAGTLKLGYVAPYHDVYLLKTNREGEKVWDHTYGSDQADFGYAVQQTADGGYVVVGTTGGFGAWNSKIYLIKVDTNGTQQWQQSFSAGGYGWGYAVQQTRDGGYIVVGRDCFEGSCKIYLLRLDAVGNVQWGKAFGGGPCTYNSGGISVLETDDGGFVVLGILESTCDSASYLYLFKTDALGERVIWERQFGKSYVYHDVCAMQPTVDGGYIVAWGVSGGAIDLYLAKIWGPPAVEWERTFGGPLVEWAAAGCQAHDGGYIAAGGAEIDWSHRENIYLVKVNPVGAPQWDQRLGGSSAAYDIQETRDAAGTADGYIVVGQAAGSGYPDLYDFYLVKTNLAGTPVWDRRFGGTGNHIGHAVRQTSDGGYIAAGYSEDVYLVKTDRAGNLVWERSFGDPQKSDYGYAVQQTADGGYVVAGASTSGTGGPGYLLKVDAGGGQQWARTYGGIYTIMRAVAETSDSGFILVGQEDLPDSREILVIRTDSGGEPRWTKTYGGVCTDIGFSVAVDRDGGYVVLGNREVLSNQNTCKGGSYFDLFKVNSEGQKLWETMFGWSDGYRYECSVQPTRDGGYLVAGRVWPSTTGSTDVYMAKLSFGVLPPTFPDCNANGVDDAADIAQGTSQDCNSNGIPDECDLASGVSQDCDSNGVPDECQPDCDRDGIPDVCAIAAGAPDCNGNGIPDACDIASGRSKDVNGNGVPDECEALPLSGLISLWRAEGNAQDSAGGNHGTLEGDASFAPGVIGQAFHLDGVDDYVAVGTSVRLTDEVTLAAWVYLEGSTGNGQMVYYHGAHFGEAVLEVSDAATGGFSITMAVKIGQGADPGDGSGWYGVGAADIILESRTWYHLAGTYTAATGTVRIFVNGMLQGEQSTPALPLHFESGYLSSIGEYAQSQRGEHRFFKGSIDEVMLYDRALAAEEIRSIYETGNPVTSETATFTFDSGPGPEFSIVNSGGLYTIDQDGPDLRISKPADDGAMLPTGFIAGGVFSTFTVDGDFTITVDFALPDFPATGQAGQLAESALGISAASCSLFSVLRFREGSNDAVEVYTNFWGPAVLGGTPASLTDGRYRITRVGTQVTGYFAAPDSPFTMIGSESGSSGPVRIFLMAIQGVNPGTATRSTTGLDISFDNLVVEAERILPDQEGLVSWWRADDDASDSAGTNHGTLENSVTFVPGVSGQAFHFDGVDDMVVIPDPADGSFRTSEVTVAAWVKLESEDGKLYGDASCCPGLQYIVFKRNPRGPEGTFDAYTLVKTRRPTTGENVFTFVVDSESWVQTGASPFLGSTPVRVGEWYHVAGTYDGATVRLYVNGALEGESFHGFPLYHSDRPVVIGRTGEDGEPGEGNFDAAFNGLIDDVRIYNRTLSCVEIEALYANDLPPASTPVTPPNFKAELNDQDGVQLTWENVAGETGYVVERKVGGGKWENLPDGDVPADVTTYTDPNPPVGEVCYRVSAVSVAGASVPTAEVCVTVEPAQPPAPPRNLTVSAAPSNVLKLQWEASSGNATRFVVERRAGPSCSWEPLPDVPAPATICLDPQPPWSNWITYRVAAVNGAGPSAWVESDSISHPAIPRWQLKIYDPNAPSPDPINPAGGSLVDLSPCDPRFKDDRGTAVIVHGWNPPEEIDWRFCKLTGICHWDGDINSNQTGTVIHWPLAMARVIHQRLGVATGVNVLVWDWLHESTGPLPLPLSRTGEQAVLLANTLKAVLPSSYAQPLHVMGHSLGTFVVSEACLELMFHRQSVAGTFHVNQLTLFDPADSEPTNSFVIVNNLTDRVRLLRQEDVYVDLYAGATNRGDHFSNLMVNVPGISHAVFNWYQDTIPVGSGPLLKPGSSWRDCLAGNLPGHIGFGASILVDPVHPEQIRPQPPDCETVGTLKFSKLSLCSNPLIGLEVFGLDNSRECQTSVPPVSVSVSEVTTGDYWLREDWQPNFDFVNSTEMYFGALPSGGGDFGVGGQLEDEPDVRYTLDFDIQPEWDYLSFEYDFTEAPAPTTLSVVITTSDGEYTIFQMTSELVLPEGYLDTGLRDIRPLHGQTVAITFELRSTQPGMMVYLRNLTFWKDQWNGNRPPIANAGPDQNVTVNSTDPTTITLDGSETFDPDGDELSYWWMVDGELLADGVTASVQLSTGRYPITLVVYDPTNQVSTDDVLVVISSTFVRGDANGDGEIDLADAIRTLFGLFMGWELTCEDAADADDNGVLELTDVIFTLTFLFLDGKPPSEPYPTRGADTTPDTLGCDRY